MGYILNARKKHVSGLKQTDKNDRNLGYIFLLRNESNEQPRSQGLSGGT